jgi:uncharacterized damage-inducible protein DinB
MAGAEWIWLERWHGRSPAKAEAWSMWTTESCGDLSVLNDRWQGVIDQRSRFISELDEARLEAELAFKLLSGDPGSMRLVDQIHHVANHATMHRGQVVGMIRQLGIDPPSTDLLFYLRRDISPKYVCQKPDRKGGQLRTAEPLLTRGLLPLPNQCPIPGSAASTKSAPTFRVSIWI